MSPIMSITTDVEQAVPATFTFSTIEEYTLRHEQGTLIEMGNEIEVLKRYNEKRMKFNAWVLAPIPGMTTAFAKSWILLVRTPAPSEDTIFPSVTDRFKIDMEATIERPDGKFSLVHLAASRIQNPYENVEQLPNPLASKYAAFKVDVPRAWQNDDGVNVELDLMATMQCISGLNDFSAIDLAEGQMQHIVITWDTFSLTYEAELAALRFLTEDKRIEEREPSFKSRDAFRMIQSFRDTWTVNYDLHAAFPHLKQPTHPNNQIPQVLVEKFKAFNEDHRAAYDGLTEIPNGLYFVNGCPGAGKTEWNLVLAALIQSKKRRHTKRRHTPILFVVDLNKTVDDAADRYFCLCKSAGLKLRIVRMHGWPYEMRHSNKLQKKVESDDIGNSEEGLDFTNKFITTVNVAKYAKTERDPNKAPTLDEAAWDYYEKHSHDCFTSIKRVLERMDSGAALSTEDWKAIRNQVSTLYRAVLAQTDFIATTPVAAYGNFSKLYRPELVFIDEAPHARELTSLIPLAFFDPIAWILTGDVKQTRPFVKGGDRRDALRNGLRFNPHAEQLRVSMMARADAVGAINSKLLVNKRALGNLQALPSKMFYNSQMTSGYDEEGKYPQAALHMKMYLSKLGNVPDVAENRVVVHLSKSSEETQRGSFWNPRHHAWVIQQVEDLLKDAEFRNTKDSTVAGKIMIQTPYSTSVRQYAAAAKKWPSKWQERVRILTVDKAQGNEADVVFLDMVRTVKAGFMNQPERLNVAITRARQAEIVIMHPGMTWRMSRGQRVKAEYTSQIWDDAKRDGRVFTL